MVIVKRLYTFMLERFLPLLTMTFFICLFIVLMQFLFRYIDDMVGKGLPIDVIGELFFYAALTMVPTALPLAVLLASLMTFGNLGEKFELTALKAAGISLFKIMKPLIILMSFIAVGAFFFQNNVLPVAQAKMWTLLFSMRQKSPEVEIPEKSFYHDIPHMNLYVEKKNRETGVMYGMIIYDMSRGQDNTRVILADSGSLNFTEDKTRLFLHLYNGELFENMRDNSLGSNSGSFLPFRRESFGDKQIYIMFDDNFNRMDENTMRQQYVGKNIAELTASIDSIQHIVDSIGDSYGHELKTYSYVSVPYYIDQRTDSGYVRVPRPPVSLAAPLDVDSVFRGSSPSMGLGYLGSALSRARQDRDSYRFRSTFLTDEEKLMRRHDIERQKKFTLSFACLIFFFIGAPLGAIIKKGGIGTPLVISVFLFIVYFIIDNMGYKLARDGKLAVWEGIWLSSAVLLPLGIFFTYKAVGDSQVFNVDAYVNFFNRISGRRMRRTLEPKTVIMKEVDPAEALRMLTAFRDSCTHAWSPAKGLGRIRAFFGDASLDALTGRLNDIIEYLSNARNKRVIKFLNEYPFSLNRRNMPGVIENTGHLIDIYSNEVSSGDQPTA